VTRLAATGAPRRGVLKVAVAALAGVTLAAEPAEAKKKKVKVCKCPDAIAQNCTTKKVAKKKAKKVAKQACNYKGKCQAGVVGSQCTAAPRVGCAVNTDCPAGQVCQNAICVTPGTPGGGKAPGTLCATTSECAPPFTCALPLNDSGGDKRCCGASGAPCGGDNIDLDDQPPICCQGFICSTDGLGTSTPGTCQPVE
jgi:Cys-rich repeat protein